MRILPEILKIICIPPMAWVAAVENHLSFGKEIPEFTFGD
jgi:hypothetical protein